MKKSITLAVILFSYFVLALPVLAQSGDVAQIETFIKSVISILVKIAGLVAAGFFVWGGFGYITSSGNPEMLDRSKKTILYSAIGLAIVLGSFVLTNIVSDVATGAFGATQ
jgi:TRAP-type C4-dicarboxylate transport system permease small subunit